MPRRALWIAAAFLLALPAFAQTTPPNSSAEGAEEGALDELPPSEKKDMSLDEQIEAIDADSASKPKKAPPPLPPSTATAEKKSLDTAEAKPETKPEEGFLGLDFTQPIGAKHSWYRGSGEWIASRTVREGLVGDEPVTKILTDGRRYDLSIGKRIPVLGFNEESLTRAWSIGFDGGMAVSLFRNKGTSSNVTFATENFDGFFGFYVARAMDDTILMYRMGHISAHLVDNHPRVSRAIPYSRWWNELIWSQTLSTVTQASPWDVHLQGAIGANFKSEPKMQNPRWLAGIDIGRNIGGPASWAVVFTFDARHAGVRNQKDNYSLFLGLGRLRRPETVNRPVKFGVSHHWGADYRNQFFNKRGKFTAFEIQVDF